MCIVYQAWDTRLQRNVAVKRLEPPLNEDPRTRARFDREGRALAQLSHPNLVTLIDRGSSENEDYLVFEYVEGRSLKELIREGPLGVGEVGPDRRAGGRGTGRRPLGRHRPPRRQAAEHPHRPATATPRSPTSASPPGPDWTRVTRAGSIIGSARYMSPEQIRSKPVDARSDIYSLGVVMYEMLAGHPPFDGTNMPEIARHAPQQPPPPPSASVRTDLPAGWRRWSCAAWRSCPRTGSPPWTSCWARSSGWDSTPLSAWPRWPRRTSASSRRGAADERAAAPCRRRDRRDDPRSARGKTPATASWAREQARVLARKTRASRRWKILGALAAIARRRRRGPRPDPDRAAARPAVVGLTLDEARSWRKMPGWRSR